MMWTPPTEGIHIRAVSHQQHFKAFKVRPFPQSYIPRIQPNFLPVNMVNFHDPAVIEQDSGTYTLSTMYYVSGSTTSLFSIVVLTKLSHAVGGLYM